MKYKIFIVVIMICQLSACATTNGPKAFREPQFENEYVKVWKTVIPPNGDLKMHYHPVARIVVGIKGGTLTRIEENGDKSPLPFPTGKAVWYDPEPEGILHGDLNDTGESIEVMLIEVKGITNAKKHETAMP